MPAEGAGGELQALFDTSSLVIGIALVVPDQQVNHSFAAKMYDSSGKLFLQAMF